MHLTGGQSDSDTATSKVSRCALQRFKPFSKLETLPEWFIHNTFDAFKSYLPLARFPAQFFVRAQISVQSYLRGRSEQT